MIKTVQRPTVPPVMEQKKLEQGEVFVASVPTVEDSGEPNGGRKNDNGKLRYDLISPEWEEGLAEILTGAPGVGGAGEYGARNWEDGLDVSRVYAALRRHIAAWIKGEDNDVKSGKSHLFHANACLMFLWAMPTIHPERDDRGAICLKRSVQKLDEANAVDAKVNG